MPRLYSSLLVFSLAAARAQQGPQDETPVSRVPAPSWMKWGAEYRGRFESPSAVDFNADSSDRYYLHRIRLWTGIGAAPWLRFYVQGQAAFAPGFDDPDGKDAVVQRFGFRQAHAEFGRAEGAWALRLGRQELAFGDERLVGADSLWDPLGQTFDAARVTYRGSGFRLDAFGALAPDKGNRLYGLYAALDRAPRGAVLEPYLLVKTARAEPAGNVITSGLRSAGALPLRSDYNLEMALQGGREAGQPIRAWAGHWELGVRPFRADLSPRLSAEYNYATGDKQPGDGRHTTFDDLYPAGYNKFGMADPFAWRNIRNVSGSVEWSLGSRWKISAGYRAFWLAAIEDGLYTEGDDTLARNPDASSDHVGDQASAMLTYAWSKKPGNSTQGTPVSSLAPT